MGASLSLVANPSVIKSIQVVAFSYDVHNAGTTSNVTIASVTPAKCVVDFLKKTWSAAGAPTVDWFYNETATVTTATNLAIVAVDPGGSQVFAGTVRIVEYY